MKRSIFKATALSLAIILPASSLADTGSKVASWFDNMNYATVTSPGVYEGQSARFATLGGISARAPITQPFNFVSVQTPKFSAGCGGIDFYAGGFSAIDANQFIDNLRAIGQNAQSLAFMLAIQIVSPQLSGVMEDIQTWSNKYLNMNMDSCEAASKLVGGALQYFDQEKANCITTRQNDYGEDFSTASFACTTGGSRKSTVGSDGEVNKTDFVKGNLAWYVLMQDPFFQADTEFAEVVLNIIGSVIIADMAGASDTPVEIRIIEPAIKDVIEKERFQNIYTALLYGNQATEQLRVYRCIGATSDPNSCASMTNSLQTINPAWTGLYARVEQLLQSIITKIDTDSALSLQERGLIASTNVPIYRFLSASTTYFPRGTDISKITQEYTTLIAHDILLRSLDAVIQRVEQRSSTLRKGMSEATRIKAFREDLEAVMRGLAKLRQDNEYTTEQLISMQERIYKYEKALLPKLGGEIVTAAMWGKK
ncbi:hypothetical protein B9Q17_00210 [Marinobacter vinifirmus]|uniref:Conjugal transfer protein TraH n=1 Tax=Marinobacter vinifirmus TaxID=355591 RepID=A0A7Z1ILJ2_9GAMM|nr:conjugal transfer protein TraH [Marinobacter vinifirmus]OZC34959.1 hypothetical protein B9Q17_00210 [Marinobacter vinifirmus]